MKDVTKSYCFHVRNLENEWKTLKDLLFWFGFVRVRRTLITAVGWSTLTVLSSSSFQVLITVDPMLLIAALAVSSWLSSWLLSPSFLYMSCHEFKCWHLKHKKLQSLCTLLWQCVLDQELANFSGLWWNKFSSYLLWHMLDKIQMSQ